MTKAMWLCAYVAGAAWIGTMLTGAQSQVKPAGRVAGPGGSAAAASPAVSRQPDLIAARLTRAHLTGADLREANLIGASLGQAHLTGAHLEHANLSGANLCQACLVGADLRGANLAGTCLAGAKLAGAELAGALYDERTRWPAGFDPARCGAQLVE